MYSIFASVSARLCLSPCGGRRAALAGSGDVVLIGVDRVLGWGAAIGALSWGAIACRSGAAASAVAVATLAPGDGADGYVLASACGGFTCWCAI